MPSSPKQIFESLSRQVSNNGSNNSRSTTPVQSDTRLRRPLVSRILSSQKPKITVYNDPNTIIDIYAGGSAPARRYASHGTRPAGYRAGRSRATISPPRAIIHRRHGSYEPSELFQRTGMVPLTKTPRANSLGSKERRRPVTEINGQDFDGGSIPQPAVQGAAGTKLLPALPIAGSPGSPTFFAGNKELFEVSDESSLDSDAESASPGSEYRPTLFRVYRSKEADETTDEHKTPTGIPIHSYRTPENRYPRPYGNGRVKGRVPHEDSSPIPLRRVFAPRELTPNFS